MKARRNQTRNRFTLQALEGRVALSDVHGLDDGPHHERHGRAPAAQVGHPGADDPAAHNAHDDRGGHGPGHK